MPNPSEQNLSPRDRAMMKSEDERNQEKQLWKNFDKLLDDYGEWTIQEGGGKGTTVNCKGTVEKIVAAIGRGTPDLMTIENPAFFDRHGDLAEYRNKTRGKTFQEVQELRNPYGRAVTRALGKEGLNIWSGQKENITDANYRYIDASPRGKVRNAIDSLDLTTSRLEIDEQKINPTDELPTDRDAQKTLLFFYEARKAILEHPMTPPEIRAKAFTKFSWDSPDGKNRAQNMDNEKRWLSERIAILKNPK